MAERPRDACSASNRKPVKLRLLVSTAWKTVVHVKDMAYVWFFVENS